MPHYEPDEYVQAHVSDDAVNASCVASWRARTDPESRVELLVDLHNGWQFRSEVWRGPADMPEQLLRAFKKSERG